MSLGLLQDRAAKRAYMWNFFRELYEKELAEVSCTHHTFLKGKCKYDWPTDIWVIHIVEVIELGTELSERLRFNDGELV